MDVPFVLAAGKPDTSAGTAQRETPIPHGEESSCGGWKQGLPEEADRIEPKNPNFDCPRIPILIDGKEVLALIDTGSQVTMISESTFNKLFGSMKEGLMSAEGLLRVTAANGLEVPYFGYFETDVEVSGQVVKERGVLVKRHQPGEEEPESAILGMNVLQGLQRGTIPLPPAIQGFARVARGEPVYIPPTSVATVRATGIGNRKQGLQPTEVLAEGLRDGHHKGIMVASTLSSVYGSSFFAQVFNLSDEGVVLMPGTTIGTVQVIQREVAAPGHVSGEASCNRIHVSTNPSPIPIPRERPCPVDLESAECTANERRRLDGLVKANADMFFQDDQDLGYTDRVSHQMRMQDDIPVASEEYHQRKSRKSRNISRCCLTRRLYERAAARTPLLWSSLGRRTTLSGYASTTRG